MTDETAPLPAPEDFDFDDWLSDAQRTKRSTIIYKRADLLAELDDLERQLANAAEVPEADQSLADSTGALEAQYLAKLQAFHDSGLKVTVQGLTRDEIEDISKAAKAEKLTNSQTGRRLIEAALVSPKLSYDQLGALEQAIGDAQMNRIVQAYQLATMKAPEVTAPFSRKSSGQGSGQE